MRKLTRKSLDELAKTLPVIEKNFQTSFIGGGSGTSADPYTAAEFDSMLSNNNWNGGYVEGMGYVANEVYAYGNSTYPGQTSQQYFMNLSDFILSQSVAELDIWASTVMSFIPGVSQMTDQYTTRHENMMRDIQADLLDKGYTNSDSFTMVRTDLLRQDAMTYTIYDANTGDLITSRTINIPYGNWN
ncbi:MAG: hypothetical protein PHQ11_00955 [Paludibacter sp.]|nr:hypothetical protein [Paludibacter sp.]MDD4198396.1 hypothetical protein [Paludibacter sp.]MDD4427074.1 hypothetical protein [Paludibacter sp.]